MLRRLQSLNSQIQNPNITKHFLSISNFKIKTHSMEHYQNVVVMRHGDRLDNFDPLWVKTTTRPYDPPLYKSGLVRAFNTGKKLRETLGFSIDRVFVSPFLRCVETANEVVGAFCAVDVNDVGEDGTSKGVKIDPSKVKVSIDYGLCEMLNSKAIYPENMPKDGNFVFNVSELESVFPVGTVDRSVEPVYKEVPKWEESVIGARTRYKNIIKELADKYPSQNLLLVTHGEGVGVSVSAFNNTMVYEVEYCGHSNLRRTISGEVKSSKAGEFEVHGYTGISFLPEPENGTLDNAV